MKIDIAKGGSWAYIFGKLEIFIGPVCSPKNWKSSRKSLVMKVTHPSDKSNIDSVLACSNIRIH